MIKVVVAAMLVALGSVDQASAWGEEGHAIVAEIAQRRLNDKAAVEVQRLLKSEIPQTQLSGTVAIASIASWADDYRADKHDETRNWHFVDIPVDRHDGSKPEDVRYDEGKDCPPDTDANGTCILRAIDQQIAILHTPETAGDTAGLKKRLMALKFIVHFVGDLHQPLHCAERDHDAGGNGFHVFFSGNIIATEERTNFHRVWDTLIIQDREYAWGSYVRRLERDQLAGHDEAAMAGGSLVDWANECHAAALKAYALVPADLTLTRTQAKDEYAIAEKLLAEAGVRLARVLNEAIGQ